jgi:hypothetical protein
LEAVTVYFVELLAELGVPEITQVEVLIESPVGNDGDAEQLLKGSLLEAPPSTNVGVMEAIARPVPIEYGDAA